MQPKQSHADLIKNKAIELGFLSCGISKADFLEKEAPRLENWLHQNRHGEMDYMANHFDKRLDPRKLVDDAKSVITVLLNYFPKEDLFQDQPLKISKYAYGRDYHKVIKKKLQQLTQFIQDEIGEVNGRAFVDSAPVMDKAWAEKSGLGWIGKNSNLLAKKTGSFFFIGELILDLPLPPDSPITQDYCGSCTKCIDACPTDAIFAPFQVDGSKCISYYTIELKDKIPEEVKGQFEGWVFGCDICQDVCPWNRFSQPTQEQDFEPKSGVANFSSDQITEITREVFDETFAGTPLKRTKYEGFKRNVDFVKNDKN